MQIFTRKRSIVCPFCGYHGNPAKPVEASFANIILPNVLAFMAACMTLLIGMLAVMSFGAITIWSGIGPILALLFGIPITLISAAATFATVQIWAFRRFFGINKARVHSCPSCARKGLLDSAGIDGQLYIRAHLTAQPGLQQCGCGYVGRFIVPERLTLFSSIMKGVGAFILVLWLLLGMTCTVPAIATMMAKKPSAPQAAVAPDPAPVRPGKKAAHAPAPRAPASPDPLDTMFTGSATLSFMAGAFTLLIPLWLLVGVVRRLAESRRSYDQCPGCLARYPNGEPAAGALVQ